MITSEVLCTGLLMLINLYLSLHRIHYFPTTSYMYLVAYWPRPSYWVPVYLTIWFLFRLILDIGRYPIKPQSHLPRLSTTLNSDKPIGMVCCRDTSRLNFSSLTVWHFVNVHIWTTSVQTLEKLVVINLSLTRIIMDFN